MRSQGRRTHWAAVFATSFTSSRIASSRLPVLSQRDSMSRNRTMSPWSISMQVGNIPISNALLHPPVAVQVLPPYHLVLGSESPPRVPSRIRANPDHHKRGLFLEPLMLAAQRRHRCHTWETPPRETQQHHFAAKVLERQILPVRCGDREFLRVGLCGDAA